MTPHHNLRDTVQYTPHEGVRSIPARVIGVSSAVRRYDLDLGEGNRAMNVPADQIARDGHEKAR